MTTNDLISIVVAKLHAKRYTHKYAEPAQDFAFGYACAMDDAIEILEAYYDKSE